MILSYWECKYSDCDDYEDEEGTTVYIYNCKHPLNKDKYCDLDNKWCADTAKCTLLDTEI